MPASLESGEIPMPWDKPIYPEERQQPGMSGADARRNSPSAAVQAPLPDTALDTGSDLQADLTHDGATQCRTLARIPKQTTPGFCYS